MVKPIGRSGLAQGTYIAYHDTNFSEYLPDQWHCCPHGCHSSTAISQFPMSEGQTTVLQGRCWWTTCIGGLIGPTAQLKKEEPVCLSVYISFFPLCSHRWAIQFRNPLVLPACPLSWRCQSSSFTIWPDMQTAPIPPRVPTRGAQSGLPSQRCRSYIVSFQAQTATITPLAPSHSLSGWPV